MNKGCLLRYLYVLIFLALAAGVGVGIWVSLEYLGGDGAAIAYLGIPLGAVCMTGATILTCCPDVVKWKDEEDENETQPLV